MAEYRLVDVDALKEHIKKRTVNKECRIDSYGCTYYEDFPFIRTDVLLHWVNQQKKWQWDLCSIIEDTPVELLVLCEETNELILCVNCTCEREVLCETFFDCNGNVIKRSLIKAWRPLPPIPSRG